MILNVSKDNQKIASYDLLNEIKGQEDSSVTFMIGRSNSCFIVLDDQRISREHAALKFSKGEWFIDQVSEFGEILNHGRPIKNITLKGGENLAFGPFNLQIDGDIDVGESTATHVEIENENITEENSTEETNEFSSEEESNGDFSDGETEDENEFSPGESEPEGDFSESYEEGTNSFDLDDVGEQTGGDYEVDTYEDAGEKTQVFQNFARFELELFGEFAPYDKFKVEDKEIVIGRDPAKCNIVLADGEVSSVHAKLIKNNAILMIEDQDSGNGTILNGERVNKAQLVNDDEFIIGSTTFTVKAFSDLIKSEEERLMPVAENQFIEVQEIVEVDSNFDDGDDLSFEDEPKNQSLFSKDALKDPAKRKKLIYIFCGLMMLLLMLDDGEDTKKKKPIKKKKAPVTKVKKGIKKLSPEQLQFVDSRYQLAVERYENGAYGETITELDKIFAIIPEYKNAKQYYTFAKEGLRKLEEIDKKRREEEERRIRMQKVKTLVEKAKEATKDRKVEVAESYFAQVLELDPENFDIPQLKLDLDAWKKEEERKRIQEEFKKQERLRKVNALKPSKSFYNQKKWHSAILKLDEFLLIPDMDEDLTKEATKMLSESKDKLRLIIAPLIGKARSLKEGQDLKGAYEHYFKVLKFDPNHVEALNEMDAIRDELHTRSKKIYREAIISESLNLYDDAKEKFQEVQQISPTDSEYYRKATDKLKNYID